MAIHLNANFHSSLLREIDWIDPIILSRFLWNIPLILNWLENLLIKIYEFQRHFIPVCHFPVRKKIVSSVEMLYRRMLEATFLTKTCIIIVEAIMRREHREAGRCSEARHLIRSLVGVLTGHKSFLEEDAYRVLDGM
ncbi:hypothetical protein C0J52_03337 [Blattella germanica]|nr:hypothetical protein C0J52_03337 [Blattella germanica]